MRVKWLERFNGKDAGHVEDVPEEKGKFWLSRGMVEKVVKKATPPKDKLVKETRNKGRSW